MIYVKLCFIGYYFTQLLKDRKVEYKEVILTNYNYHHGYLTCPSSAKQKPKLVNILSSTKNQLFIKNVSLSIIWSTRGRVNFCVFNLWCLQFIHHSPCKPIFLFLARHRILISIPEHKQNYKIITRSILGVPMYICLLGDSEYLK